ncbi:hypothetical protein TSAR_005424 [Trichomalopsis sarcophagae]|uniref:Uncharacterized protein n=1 Tax=Trichomalopsis sarcophagae TaxID=543379 RepID=A0A232ER67_9HYME|nr:hypothetical protein TSAR_005424 [Trichomalopsis sarcophagae]
MPLWSFQEEKIMSRFVHTQANSTTNQGVRTFSSMLSIWMTNSIANSGDDTPAIFSAVFVITGLRKKRRMKLLIPNFFHGLRGPRSSVILVRGFEGFSEVLKCVKEMRDAGERHRLRFGNP